jgi:hypothetical protein
MADQSRSKLNFGTNVPVTFKILFDSPQTGESDRGPWWRWTVEDENGEEVSIFPNETLEKILETADVATNDLVTVTKVKKGAEAVRWDVDVNGQHITPEVTKPSQERAQTRQQPQQQQTAPAPGKASHPSRLDTRGPDGRGR